jgi:REP element-mobilizing transposase RayT
MNRGIARRVIFPDRAAKRRFIALMACAVRRRELEVESFCVMDTHFHLMARSPEGRIHYPLMRILNAYARYFNRRFRRDGPVFRGRYCSWPVLTFVYWRILVRYIDFNPVKAGLCSEPASYPYGSAWLYVLRDAGPRWLARSAVEAHVAFCVGNDNFGGRDYLRVFGSSLTESEAEIVERRIRRVSRAEDPLDALQAMPAPRIARWMRRKAELADGLAPWAPILGVRCIRKYVAKLERDNGAFLLRPARNQLDAWRLMEVALLHETAGLGIAEIARVVGCAGSTATLRLQRHRQAMLRDDTYADRISEAVKALLDQAYPRGLPS